MVHSAGTEKLIDLSFVGRRDLPDLLVQLDRDGHDADVLGADADAAVQQLLDDLDAER